MGKCAGSTFVPAQGGKIMNLNLQNTISGVVCEGRVLPFSLSTENSMHQCLQFSYSVLCFSTSAPSPAPHELVHCKTEKPAGERRAFTYTCAPHALAPLFNFLAKTARRQPHNLRPPYCVHNDHIIFSASSCLWLGNHPHPYPFREFEVIVRTSYFVISVYYCWIFLYAW